MGKLPLSLSRQKTLSPARRMDRAKALVASREAMAEHRLEALSHETAAWRGVQAGWPRLTDTVSTDCESPFMKAGCGKTARTAPNQRLCERHRREGAIITLT